MNELKLAEEIDNFLTQCLRQESDESVLQEIRMVLQDSIVDSSWNDHNGFRPSETTPLSQGCSVLGFGPPWDKGVVSDG